MSNLQNRPDEFKKDSNPEPLLFTPVVSCRNDAFDPRPSADCPAIRARTALSSISAYAASEGAFRETLFATDLSICRMTEEKSAPGSSFIAAEFTSNAAAVAGNARFDNFAACRMR